MLILKKIGIEIDGGKVNFYLVFFGNLKFSKLLEQGVCVRFAFRLQFKTLAFRIIKYYICVLVFHDMTLLIIELIDI